MKIVVCLRAPPPDPEGDALGQADALALAQALGLKADGREVTALLAGTSMEAGPLRLALAAGADRAVRVVADDLASADFHTTGQVLAIALRRIGGEAVGRPAAGSSGGPSCLILAGVRSDNEGLGASPAAIARHLGIGYIAGVEALEALDDQTVAATVRDGGRLRRLRARLPVVLSVSSASQMSAAPPRLGEPPAIETLSLSDPEATVVRRRTELLGRPEPASRGVETVSSAAALVAALARR
jgi:electron transfer flavoprotein alpha/beta subunit